MLPAYMHDVFDALGIEDCVDILAVFLFSIGDSAEKCNNLFHIPILVWYNNGILEHQMIFRYFFNYYL